jgi:N-acetylmuramoyl-L-alanine amidase
VRRTVLYRVQRIFAIIGFGALFAIVITVARIFGVEVPLIAPATQALVLPAFNDQVALISGHRGHDSGAICTDAAGNVTLTEADVNAAVAERAAELLRRAGTDVVILDEYDPQLTRLEVDALLSLHADSCIDASGYKAANYTFSAIPAVEAEFLACIDAHYPQVTGLVHHPNTVTHDMTEYHAFRKIAPTTPAAILELGFLGGDQELLTTNIDLAARGVVDSILCFLSRPTSPDAE